MLPVDFVLIRGLARESRHWGDFISSLEKQDYCRSVTCIDLPGFGEFNQISSPLSIEAIADFAYSQIKKNQSERKVLVSVSLGAMVSAELLSRHDHLFMKAFLMNTSFSNLSPFYHRMQLQSLQHFLGAAKAGQDAEKREAEIVKMISNSPDKLDKISKEWARVFKDKPFSLFNVFRQLLAASRYKIKKEPPKTPIVVLRSLGDRMVNPSCSEEFSQFWNLKLLSHPWAGHDLCIDDESWVLDCIRRELTEIKN